MLADLFALIVSLPRWALIGAGLLTLGVVANMASGDQKAASGGVLAIVLLLTAGYVYRPLTEAEQERARLGPATISEALGTDFVLVSDEPGPMRRLTLQPHRAFDGKVDTLGRALRSVGTWMQRSPAERMPATGLELAMQGTLQDNYGERSTEVLLTVSWDRETLDRARFDNLSHAGLVALSVPMFVHPAMRADVVAFCAKRERPSTFCAVATRR